ncbi:NAD-dependent epimerase/dehydratase, partial [Dillenia turbinata]
DYLLSTEKFSLFEMENRISKVCVTGGAGYIGSWLVKKLLSRGYAVHATLRNLGDASKVGLLKSFPGAEARLVLFEADIYKPSEFEQAIKGCDFVFHVATPFQHYENSKKLNFLGGKQYRNVTEAAVAGAKSIVMSCISSGCVKKLIYTASVVAASPLKDDGFSFKDFMDETCWTPLDAPYPYHGVSFLKDYTDSKTLVEKEILKYGRGENDGFEVVTLACGLVGGDGLLSSMSTSQSMFVSQLANNEFMFRSTRFLEELLAKVPIIHIDDVCEAHIFCMEETSIKGRFLCASSYVATADIASYYQEKYPEFHVMPEYVIEVKRETKWGATKLNEMGFKYKYGMEMTLDDCVKYARRMGLLQ